jgi:trk system potassium uptake protein TrkA
MRVLIAGGGNVGVFLASELLAAGHQVVIIEVDEARVTRQQEAREPKGAVWSLGDACEVSELAAAEPERADVVAAVTGDDEDNLVISLLAKQEFGVPRVVARVNNPKNEWLFNESWGVDVSVSTPHLLVGLVEEAVTVGSLVRLLSFEHGAASLVEVTLAGNSPAIGADVAGAGFPRDSTVVAIVRGDHVVVPRGDTTFLEGDEVMVLVTGDGENKVRSLLIGERESGEPARSRAGADDDEKGAFHKRPTSW